MHEMIKVFLITFVSDLDNLLILGAIIRKHSNLNIVVPTAVVLTLTRSVYVMLIDRLFAIPLIHLFMGLILLFIAFKLSTRSFADETLTRPGDRTLSLKIKALFLLAATDFLICLDSVMVISNVSQNMIPAIMGIFLSLLLSLLFLPFIIKLAIKFSWINIVAGAFIAQTAVIGMVNDPWLKSWVSRMNLYFPRVNMINLFANSMIVLVIFVGCFSYFKNRRLRR
ncbi:hypothetical protein MUB24_13980 [Lederbergia sp. NSJ-179]|uniref:TerC family protein n=1 Tax=Lederbergia sp. NSJ-179 TaxID=2931402 RepID=UPI001FD3F2E6|nr:hypothetical protein [Lederbergia sp. NSJ-179]MCJ7841989.1 hypothetical protein [Lederbergia sp. NSJ-179]